MKVSACNCTSKKEILCNQKVYPYIDVPMFGRKPWSTSSKQELYSIQLEHNYCPQCDQKYREVEK